MQLFMTSTHSCSTGSCVLASGWVSVGGSHMCSARLHKRTCMSQERRLYFLYLLGVEGWSLASLRCLRRSRGHRLLFCGSLNNWIIYPTLLFMSSVSAECAGWCVSSSCLQCDVQTTITGFFWYWGKLKNMMILRQVLQTLFFYDF